MALPQTTNIDYTGGNRKEFGDSYADIVQAGPGHTSMCIVLKPGFDWRKSVSPLLPGCPQWCPATHFGFLKSGCMKVKYESGEEKTVNAGESYLIPPGHLPEIVGEEPAVMVEFSQSTADIAKAMKEQ